MSRRSMSHRGIFSKTNLSLNSTVILASSVLHLVIISPGGARHNIIDTRSRARGFCRLAGVLFMDSVGACQERGQAR